MLCCDNPWPPSQSDNFIFLVSLWATFTEEKKEAGMVLSLPCLRGNSIWVTVFCEIAWTKALEQGLSAAASRHGGSSEEDSCRREPGGTSRPAGRLLCAVQGHPRESPRATGGLQFSRGNGEGRAGTFSCYSSWTLSFLQLYWDIIGRQPCKLKVYYVLTCYVHILQNDRQGKAA